MTTTLTIAILIIILTILGAAISFFIPVRRYNKQKEKKETHWLPISEVQSISSIAYLIHLNVMHHLKMNKMTVPAKEKEVIVCEITTAYLDEHKEGNQIPPINTKERVLHVREYSNNYIKNNYQWQKTK